MIRVGLIGCGFMGGMHAACYAALAELGVKVTAIADDRPEFLAQMKEQTDAQTYESGMALIEQADVDVVDICLPTYLHTAHACAAMEKGRDVFCEKPVCLTEEDMQALLETKKRTGRKVMVGQVIRLWDEYAWLKKTVDAGTYGRVLSGVFTMEILYFPRNFLFQLSTLHQLLSSCSFSAVSFSGRSDASCFLIGSSVTR